MLRTSILGLLLLAQQATLPPLPGAPQTAPGPIVPGASKNFAPLVNKESQSWTERYVDVPVLGQTSAYVPKAPTTDVVLFVSGDDGWQLGVVDMARRIVAHHVVVIGLNFVWMRRNVGEVACWDTAAELDA